MLYHIHSNHRVAIKPYRGMSLSHQHYGSSLLIDTQLVVLFRHGSKSRKWHLCLSPPRILSAELADRKFSSQGRADNDTSSLTGDSQCVKLMCISATVNGSTVEC